MLNTDYCFIHLNLHLYESTLPLSIDEAPAAALNIPDGTNTGRVRGGRKILSTDDEESEAGAWTRTKPRL